MKKALYILTIILAVFACDSRKVNDTQETTKYFFVIYDLELPAELNLDTIEVNISTEIQDSVYSLTYVNEYNIAHDTVIYKLKESENYQPEYYFNGAKAETNNFVFVSKENSQINGQKFNVYKYARNPFAIDGCVTHFWTPEIGIIIKRSATWRNFSKLQTNDFDLNQKINLLAELIYQDTEFYKGCVEEQELIPKSIAKEFFDWRMKEMERELK
jgi:hypothetical protein